MTVIDIVMIVFLGVVAVVSLGWFIYESRSDDEK